MDGAPWIKLASDLPFHPKALALRRRLRDQRAWAWPVRLWLYAARFAPDGRFRDAAEVEAAAEWAGKRGALVAALLACRFLDRRGRQFTLHGWEEWTGGDIERMRRDRERKRRERAEVSEGRPQDARGTSTGRPALEERRTEQRTCRTDDTTSPLQPPPSDGEEAGRPEEEASSSSSKEEDQALVEQYRAAVSQRLGTRISGCKPEQVALLAAHVRRLGLAAAVQVAEEVSGHLLDRGKGHLFSLAALPRWLDTVGVPDAEQPGAHLISAQSAKGRHQVTAPAASAEEHARDKRAPWEL